MATEVPSPGPLAAIRSLSAFRALASDLFSRFGFATRAGLTFDGKRDLYSALGYSRKLQVSDFRGRYCRNGIGARIVEAAPKATWRGEPELIEDEDPEVSTLFEEQWNDLQKRLGVWSSLCRADILAGIGRYAVLLIGAPGDLNTELPTLRGPDDVLYLTPYSEDEAVVATYTTDSADERFGLPETYTLGRTGVVAAATLTGRTVHWTRVIHIADGLLEDRVFGQPRQERVWNWLDDLEKCTGAGSEAFWLRVHQGMQINLDKDLAIEADELSTLRDKVEEFEHGLRRTLTTRGADVSMFGSDVSNFSSQVACLISLISGATGIPQRILLGSERGELASSQDQENWDTRIAERRMDFAEPIIVRPLVRRLIEHGALVEPSDYAVRWPEMTSMTDAERGRIADTWAGLNSKAKSIIVTGAEIRDRVLLLPPLDPEDVAAEEASRAQNAPPSPFGAPPQEDVPPEDQPIEEGRAAAFRARPKAVVRRKENADAKEDADAEDDPDQEVRTREAAQEARALAKSAVAKLAHVRRPRVAAATRVAIREARAAVNETALIHALSERSDGLLQAAMLPAIAAMSEAFLLLMPEALGSIAQAAAAGARKTLPKRLRGAAAARPKAKAVVQFDLVNDAAVSWAKKRAAQLVVDVGEETRDAVRAVVSRSFADGLSARAAARVLKAVIGLDERRAEAVESFRDRLQDNPGKIVFAGDRAIRVPQDPSDAFLDRQVDRYAEKLLADRAAAISRTETLAAANEGQRILWSRAEDEGLLEGASRKWLASSNACPTCSALDGETTGIDEPFSTGDFNPPAHPNCTCGQGLVFAKHLAAATSFVPSFVPSVPVLRSVPLGKKAHAREFERMRNELRRKRAELEREREDAQ